MEEEHPEIIIGFNDEDFDIDATEDFILGPDNDKTYPLFIHAQFNKWFRQNYQKQADRDAVSCTVYMAECGDCLRPWAFKKALLNPQNKQLAPAFAVEHKKNIHEPINTWVLYVFILFIFCLYSVFILF